MEYNNKKVFFDIIKSLPNVNFIKESMRIINDLTDHAKTLSTETYVQNPRYLYNVLENKSYKLNQEAMGNLDVALVQIAKDENNDELFSNSKYTFSQELEKTLNVSLEHHYFNKYSKIAYGQELLSLLGQNKINMLSHIICKIIASLINIDKLYTKTVVGSTLIEQLGFCILDYVYNTKIQKINYFTPNDFLKQLTNLSHCNFFNKPFSLDSAHLLDKDIKLVFNDIFRIKDDLNSTLMYILLCKYLIENLENLKKSIYKKESFLNKENYHSLLKKILTNNNRKFKKEESSILDYLSDIIYLLNDFLFKLYLNMGKEIVELLTSEKYLLIGESIYDTNTKKYKPTTFILNDILLFLQVDNIFPSLIPEKQESFFNKDQKTPFPEINLNNKVTISFLSKDNDIRQHNDSIKGYFGSNENQEVYNNIFKRNAFCINFDYAIKLFSLLRDLNNQYIDYIINNDYLINGLSELYKIDFITFKKEKIFPSLYKRMVKNAIDFNNEDKIDLILELSMESPSFIKEIQNHKTMLNHIQNHLFSYKMVLRGFFKHIIVMSIFDSFFYRWFSDTRGRIYNIASFLNPQNGIQQRNAISFITNYLTPPKRKESNSVELQLFQDTKAILQEQIKSILNLPIENIIKLTLEEIMINNSIKLGEKLRLWILINDYIGFCKEKFRFHFRSFVSVDATTSGIQCNAIVTKNTALAQYCGLLDQHQDLYSVHSKLRYNEIQAMKKLYKNLSAPFLDYIKNSFIIRNKTCYETILQKDGKNITYKPFKKLSSKQQNNFYKLILDGLIQKNLTIELEAIKENLFNSYKPKFKTKKIMTLLHFKYTYNELRKIIFIVNNLNKNDAIENYLSSRKSAKPNIMTFAYGSSAYSVRQQLVSGFLTFGLTNGILIKNKEIQTVAICASFLFKSMTKWFDAYLPDFRLLYNITSKLCKKKKWGSCYEFNLGHFSYTLKPYKRKLYRYSTKLLKKIKYIGFSIPNFHLGVDYNALSRGIAPNWMQSLDSTILFYVYREISKINNLREESFINLFSIHDSFHIHPKDAISLHYFLKKAYIEFYDADLFTKVFKENYPEVYKEIIKDNKRILKKDDLSFKHFVKY